MIAPHFKLGTGNRANGIPAPLPSSTGKGPTLAIPDRTTSIPGAVAVVLCARCGSHQVDVRGWNNRTVAVLRCSACCHEAPVHGFTIGRVYQGNTPAMVAEAINDAAMPLAVSVR